MGVLALALIMAVVLPAVAVADSPEAAEAEGRHDEAERGYQARLEGPDAAEAAARLGAFYERVGEIDAAIPMYERAIAEGEFSDTRVRDLEFRLNRCRRQRASLARFPVSVEAMTDIRQVDSLLAARQWVPAFVTMTRILERFGGTFLQQQPGEYLGLWQWARDVLDTMPEAGTTAYVHWTRTAWQEALADGSLGAYRQFIADHPGRASAGPAFVAWAETLADQGRIGRAVGLVRRGEVEEDAARVRLERWTRHAGEGLPAGQEAGETPAPHHHRRDAGATPSGGRDADLPDAGATPSRGQDGDLPDTGATPSGGLQTGRMPVPQRAGRVPVPHREGLTIRFTADVDPRDLGMASADGRLFIHDGVEVHAYDVNGGERLWRYAPRDPADRVPVRREPFGKSEMPRQKWTGALDPPAVTVSPAGVLVVETYHRGNLFRVYRVVTCLDVESGQVRWRLDRDPLFERLRVTGDAFYSGGKVFVVAASRGNFPEYWLCALDAGDGRLIWRHHIAIGATPTECLGRGLLQAGQSGPLLAADGEAIYYATHMGAVVAVDRDLGQPLWATAYPRVARFGPMMRGPLPLLERRTEPMILTPRYLVLLPRDLNGVLVIDRRSGRVERVIRSLELHELVHASDEQVVVTTLAGGVYAYAINDGSLRWSHDAPEKPDDAARPVLHGDVLLVPRGEPVLHIDPDSGAIDPDSGHAVPGPLRRVGPDGTWVAFSGQAVHVAASQAATVDAWPPAPAFVARGSAPGDPYEAFVPHRAEDSRLVGTGDAATLLIADGRHLAAHAVGGDYALRWRLPLDTDGERAIWAASTAMTLATRHYHARATWEDPAGDAPLVAVCEDDEIIRLIDGITGEERAAGAMSSIVPVRSLHVVGRHVLVTGTSSLALVTAAADGTLDVLWQRDESPHVFEEVIAGPEGFQVIVQPALDRPGRLLHVRLPEAPGDDPAVESFIVSVPMPEYLPLGTQESHERFPVPRLSYGPADVRRENDRAWVRTADGELELGPAAIRLLDVVDGQAVIDIAHYWGLVDLHAAEVTIVSPFEIQADVAGRSPREQQLVRWLADNPEHQRDKTPAFRFDGPAWRLTSQPCLSGVAEPPRSCRALTNADGTSVALGRILPRRIDASDQLLAVHGETGTLIMKQERGPTGEPAHGGSWGRRIADLFAPPAVKLGHARGLVLDGDVSDWPEDGWHELDASRHAWPVRAAADDHAVEDAPRTATSIAPAFQWAMDEQGVWLAVRVERDGAAARSASWSACAPDVEVMLSGRPERDPSPYQRVPIRVPMTVSLSLADGVPIAVIRSTGYPPAFARPVGMGEAFDVWYERRYGDRPRIAEEVDFAAARSANLMTCELWIDRSLFLESEPAGFDLRIREDPTGTEDGWLQWGGALFDADVHPLALFESID